MPEASAASSSTRFRRGSGNRTLRLDCYDTIRRAGTPSRTDDRFLSTLSTSPRCFLRAINRPQKPMVCSTFLMHQSRQILILIGGDEVDSGFNSCLPPRLDKLTGTEVVRGPPASIVSGRETVQRVEPDPEAELVRVIHQRAKARGAGRCPLAGAGLAASLHRVPGIIPP